MENMKTVNSAVRTVLLLAILGFLAYSGMFVYNNYIGPSQKAKKALAELETLKADYEKQSLELEATKIERDRLSTANRLLKVTTRLANITVTEMGELEDGVPYFDVLFEEVDSYGDPIAKAREFRLKGDQLWVDCWVCKFEDDYVENADELRGTSLCIFKRILGNLDGQDGGYPLDRMDKDGKMIAPGIYHSGARMTEFEEKIWGDFWTIANDPEQQEEMGIKATHGQIDYLKVEKDRIYSVRANSTGGFDLSPLPMRRRPNGREEETNEVKVK